LKKRSKKLLILGARLAGNARKGVKVFWFFFSKKNILPFALPRIAQERCGLRGGKLLYSK
jgi:hypothetical protein